MELKLGGCGINGDGTREILQSLTLFTAMTVLDLSENIVDKQGIKHLGK